MDIRTAGVALFFLVYLYVWFKNYKRAQSMSETFQQATFGDIMDALSLSHIEMMGIVLLIFLVLFILVVSCFREWSLRIFNTAFDMSSIKCALAWALEDRVDYALQLGVIVPSLLILLMGALLLSVRMDPSAQGYTGLYFKDRARRIALGKQINRPWNEWSFASKLKYYMVYGVVALCDLFFLPFCANQVAQKSMTRISIMLNLLPMCFIILLIYNDFDIETCRARWDTRLRLPAASSSSSYSLEEFIKAAKQTRQY